MKKIFIASVVWLIILLPKFFVEQEGHLFHQSETRQWVKTAMQINSIPDSFDLNEDAFDLADEISNDSEKKIASIQQLAQRTISTIVIPVQDPMLKSHWVTQPLVASESPLFIFHRVIRI